MGPRLRRRDLDCYYHGVVAGLEKGSSAVVSACELPLKIHATVRIDGGATWQPLASCAEVASYSHRMFYSWTGKTLVFYGDGGDVSHRHAGFFWVSRDDGDTWGDETGDDLVTMGSLDGQWFEGKFYMNTAGQGILAKTLEP